MTLEQLDLITGWAALVLTLMVFSYLLNDNFLYRTAVHILVGAAAGYVAIAAVMDVIIPWLDATILTEEADAEISTRALGVLPILIAVLLLLKSLPRYAHIGNFGMLVILGIGTGVALVGAIIGTIIPLAEDTGLSVDREDAVNGFIMLIGTVTTLAYFQYLSRSRPSDGNPQQVWPLRVLRYIGQGFIAVTLGSLYAGAILTSMNIFQELLGDHIRFLFERIGG